MLAQRMIQAETVPIFANRCQAHFLGTASPENGPETLDWPQSRLFKIGFDCENGGMRFRFRLEKLLDARRIQQEIAQKHFAEAMHDLRIQEDKLQMMLDQEKQSYQQLGQALQQGGEQTSVIQNIAIFQNGLKLSMANVRKQIEGLQSVVEEKREILREKVIEYKMIEKLKEKKYQQFLQEAKRLEQKDIDEVSVLRHAHKDVE